MRRRGRPKKDPKDTLKGKRKAKQIAKMKLREEKERKKQYKKQLAKEGKCVAPDGSILTFREVGRKYGKLGAAGGWQAWERASFMERRNSMHAGNCS